MQQGGGVRSQDLVARAGAVKGQIMSFWELPGDALMKIYTDLKLSLPKAILDANGFLSKAAGMGETLKKYDITLTAPSPIM